VVRVQSRPSLSQGLADALRRSILAGEYRPGDRLPPERELAAERGVGRGTVREAFKKLEQLGLVDIRHGGGVTVRSLDQASLDLVRHLIVADGRPDRHVIEQTIEVAEVLVGATARLAVERGSPADLEGARERLAAMRCPDLDDAGYFVAEQEFMRRLEAASGNFVLCLLRNGLSALLTRAAASCRLARLDREADRRGDRGARGAWGRRGTAAAPRPPAPAHPRARGGGAGRAGVSPVAASGSDAELDRRVARRRDGEAG
jgi:GntR family transcriptional repressor for pyruvate dehydrogenase complex